MEARYLLATIGFGLLGFAYYDYLTQNPNDTTSSTLIDLGASLKNLTGGTMQTSPAGQAAIMAREGLRLAVYNDVGHLAAGYGHDLRPIDGSFAIGDAIAQEQADAWFANDLKHAENIVNFYVTVPLTENMFDALVSVAFNLGSAVFKNADGSHTGILTFLNAGDYSSAAVEFSRWTHAGGVELPMLIARRASEQQQFLA
jgi:lysozyme